MFGVFVALDLMLYYGSGSSRSSPWPSSSPCTARKDGPKARLKFFLFTFMSIRPLLVAILWLYARTHTFNFSELQYQNCQRCASAGALFWLRSHSCSPSRQGAVFPLHGWLADLQRSLLSRSRWWLRASRPLLDDSFPRRLFLLSPRPGLLFSSFSLSSAFSIGACWRLSSAITASDGLCRAEPPQPDRACHLRPHTYRMVRRASIRSSRTV